MLMWGASVVVEVDAALYHPVCMLKGVEALLAVDTFHLYFSVDALSDGVVCGIIVLTHGDSMTRNCPLSCLKRC